MKKIIRSRIKEFFPTELLIEFNKILYMDVNTRERGDIVKKKMSDFGIDFSPIGSGTNRIGVQIGDTVFKIALDDHGKTDNQREFKYTDKLQPFVIRVYECLPDGLIAACEPFTLISETEFEESKEEIFDILNRISKHFFIGDIGYTTKNWQNWGRRKTDHHIGILDFAYIYTVDYSLFRCDCPSQPFLRYDENYINLICPVCGKVWTFGQIRKRLSRKQEKAEIGDITKLSYNIHGPSEIVDVNLNYTISLYDDYKKQEKMTKKQLEKKKNKEALERLKERETHTIDEFEVDDPTSFEELMKMLDEKYQK